MSQSDMWRWADEQGEQRLVSADELRTAIGNGVLPPATLVWREGMSAWVPAISVEEFAEAIPNVTGGGTTVQPLPTKPGAGPARSTLQGIHAREVYAAVKANEKDPAKEKRTPSVAPPRPVAGGAKSPLVKTLGPSVGPAVPAAPRLPSDGPAKPALAPRPLGAIRPPAAVAAPARVQAPAPTPPARAPSTSAIDKDWSITDDETTNVPGKTATTTVRPEPPPEAAPSPRAASPQQPSRASVVRTSPPPSPHEERRPTDESTESATFQFAKNSLSLRGGKTPPAPLSEETGENPAPNADTRGNEAPPGLMESYAKQPVTKYKVDDAPPTAPSADLELSDDLIPAYAGSTTRIPSLSLPEPPKVREPTATTMLPMDFQGDADEDDPEKRPHEVSRTVRFSADFLSNVMAPAAPKPAGKTARIDTADASVRNALMQLQPPPVPPSQDGAAPQQFVQLQSGTPHAATSLALRAVQPPGSEGQQPAQLPMNALFMSGGLLITMVIGAFFVGRCSVKPQANNAPMLRTAFGNAVRVIQDNLPRPPKPCWVVKQPARWAPVVSKNVPFELLTLASGKIAIGYAKSDDEAVGITVTPTTGQVEEDYVDKAPSEIARVAPNGKGFVLTTVEPSGSLKSLIPVNAEKPFYLGYSDKHLAWSDQPNGAANRIWPINEDDVSGGIRVLSLGNRGVLTALRAGSSRQKKVFAGLLGPDRKPLTNLVQVVGSGGLPGDPMVGSNGREVAVVFGDQAGEQTPFKLRIGHAPIGKIPATATNFETPAGGPGGDASFPSITGLPDGRWVIIWSEGSSYPRAVRAQTLAPNFVPLGDPIMLSQPSGNFGPSMVGVVGNYVTIVFVAKGRSNNELWGSVLQCG